MFKLMVSYPLMIFLLAFSQQAIAAQCTSKLKSIRGEILKRFHVTTTGDRNFACGRALSKCYKELDRRRRNGRNVYATCEIEIGRGDGAPVSRSCEVHLYGNRGRFVARYFAKAWGRNIPIAERKACFKAMEMCHRDAVGSQYCAYPF